MSPTGLRLMRAKELDLSLDPPGTNPGPGFADARISGSNLARPSASPPVAAFVSDREQLLLDTEIKNIPNA